jgi:hypothetical protein
MDEGKVVPQYIKRQTGQPDCSVLSRLCYLFTTKVHSTGPSPSFSDYPEDSRCPMNHVHCHSTRFSGRYHFDRHDGLSKHFHFFDCRSFADCRSYPVVLLQLCSVLITNGSFQNVPVFY